MFRSASAGRFFVRALAWIVAGVAGCGPPVLPPDGGLPEANVPQVGGAVLVLDQTTAGGATSGSAEASFPGLELVPSAQGIVVGVTSSTQTFDRCLLATPPTCPSGCPDGTGCTGPSACSAPVTPQSTLDAGTITITGGAASPLDLTIQAGLGLYSNGAPTGALLRASETLHVAATGAVFPSFTADVAALDDLALSMPLFPTDGSSLPLPIGGGLACAWRPASGDTLALTIVAIGPAGEALLDCRPSDEAGSYTIPQPAIDALEAGSRTDGGTVVYTFFARRFRDVTLATAGGAVHLVVESVVAGPVSP